MASRRNSPEPTAPLPESERKALSRGIAFVAICAAALSAPTLYLLACLIGYPPQLAWLLPASFDGYAGTSIWVGRRIARSHPAAKAARRNARMALVLTIAGNGLYHLLVLAGNSIPRPMHIGLLVIVSSLPPFIVERLLHLNAIANGSGSGSVAAPAANRDTTTRQRAATPTAVAAPALVPAPGSEAAVDPAPAVAHPPALPAPTATPGRQASGSEGGTVTNITGSGRRSPEDWAKLALPLWHRHVGATHRTPTATELCALLRHEYTELPVPKSDRSERNIRAATEALAKADAEPEREQEAG